MTERRRTSRTAAFTLIELVVVMIVMGLLAGLVVYSIGGVTDRHQLSLAIERVQQFDARVRREANRTGQPVNVVIDRRGRLEQESNRGRERRIERLPAKVAVDEVLFGRNAAARGDAQFTVDRRGRSPSYAVQLKRGNASRWLVVLGITGQVITLQTRGEADAILTQ